MEKLMNLSLKFDCRKFKANEKRENRQMKADGEQITAFAILSVNDIPATVPKNNTFFTEINNDDGTVDKVFFKFKINSNGKFFVTQNGSGQKIKFPSNATIDGKRYVCNVMFNVLNGCAEKMEARGNYINVIQFIREDVALFASIDDADNSIFDKKTNLEVATTATTTADDVEVANSEGSVDDLPF